MHSTGIKFIKVILLFVLVAFLLSGCGLSSDFRLVSLKLIESPNRLIYTSGQDQEVDVSGGILIKNADFDGGVYMKIHMEEYGKSSFDGRYFHTDADLNKEGTYLVSIAKKRGCSWQYYFQYTIQVVSPGEYVVNTLFPEDKFTYEVLESIPCENVTAIMTSPPSNIIYPVGYDGEIDLTGIMVKPVSSQRAKDVQEYDIADLDYTLESDADFNTPGSYIVKVTFEDEKGKEYWFIFTVAVAERVG